MLYGCPDITVYTDHRNNTFSNIQTQRVMRWRLYLDDFGVKLSYVKGADNHMADMLSRLPSKRQDKLPLNIISNDNTSQSQSFYSLLEDEDLVDCFVNLPANENVPFELRYDAIRDAQQNDQQLPVLRQKHPDQYEEILLAPDTLVWCHQEDITKPTRIYLPESLLNNAIRWYHLALGHIGSTRLYETMSLHFHNPELSARIKEMKCTSCQKEKNAGRGHGHLPAREACTHPWREVAVDMIGPWTLTIEGQRMEFRALTIIDTVTNLVEIVRADDKRSETIARLFGNTWLSRYPRPMKVIHDQGGEFTGYAFQKVLTDHGIRPAPITTKNPQANSICERMHQTIGNTLRTMSNLTPPNGVETANQLVDTALANCMFATRAALHGSLKATPGSLVFSRDMILDIPLVADWLFIQENRQQLIDQRLLTANRKRFSYDYKVGEKVWKKVYEPHKLASRFEGPYEIIQVHSNGTLTIRLNPTTVERISLRRVKPYDE